MLCQKRISLGAGEAFAAGREPPGDIHPLWQRALIDLARGDEQRVERRAHIDAKIPGHIVDGLGAFLVAAAIGDGQKPLQPLFLGQKHRIVLAGDRGSQRCQCARCRVAFQRQKRLGTPGGIGIRELKLHQGHRQERTDAAVGFNLLQRVLAGYADALTAVKINQIIACAGLLGVKEQPVGLPLPHLFGLPGLQHPLRAVQTAARNRVNRRADGFARGFGDDRRMLLQDILHGRGLWGRGLRGGALGKGAKHHQQQAEACQYSSSHGFTLFPEPRGEAAGASP